MKNDVRIKGSIKGSIKGQKTIRGYDYASNEIHDKNIGKQSANFFNSMIHWGESFFDLLTRELTKAAVAIFLILVVIFTVLNVISVCFSIKRVGILTRDTLEMACFFIIIVLRAIRDLLYSLKILKKPEIDESAKKAKKSQIVNLFIDSQKNLV